MGKRNSKGGSKKGKSKKNREKNNKANVSSKRTRKISMKNILLKIF